MAELRSGKTVVMIGGGNAASAGGIVKTISMIANSLSGRGMRVHVLSNVMAGQKPFHPLEEGVKQHSISYPHSFGQIRKLRDLIGSLDPDVIVMMASNRMALRLMVAAADIPAVILRSEHGDPSHLVKHVWHSDVRGRMLSFQLADHIHLLDPVYEYSLDTARQTIPVTFIPPPITTPARSGASLTKRNHTARYRLLYAGRIEIFEKRLDDLIEAFAQLATEFEDWDLYLIGEGSAKSPLQAHAEKLGLSHRIRFEDSMDAASLYDEYSKAHIFVLPSEAEGYPMALAEALANGLPAVVMNDCTGARLIVQDGVNGVVVAAESEAPDASRVTRLANSLRQLMQSASLREQLGDRAPGSVLHLNSSQILDEWCELIGKLADDRNEIIKQRSRRHPPRRELVRQASLLVMSWEQDGQSRMMRLMNPAISRLRLLLDK